MTQIEQIREHWNQQASKGEQAGTKDLILKQLEQRAILAEVAKRRPTSVLEVGCGRGELARLLVAQCPSIEQYAAVDYAQHMINAAKSMPSSPRIVFACLDYTDLPFGPFDVAITERMVINLPTTQEQDQCIAQILSRVAHGGAYLMCEHSEPARVWISAKRVQWGLPPMPAPWHNRYLGGFFVKAQPVHFSGPYYVLSRLINAKWAQLCGCEPRYDAWINRLALRLPAWVNNWCARYSQAQLWIWEKP